MSKKDKRAKFRKSFQKRQSQMKDRILRDQRMKWIEEDCRGAPNKEWLKNYLIGAFERLDEYDINRKRNKDDPLWESDSSEIF